MNAVAALPVDHQIGANNPPDPFTAHKVNIEDLYLEAKNWLDGSAITSQEEADKVQELIRRTQEADTAADNSRIEENKPFDDGKAAVQAKYSDLIADTKTKKGLTVKIITAARAAMTVWFVKVKAEQDAIAEAARKVAEEAAAAALEAMEASAGNLEAREDAEALVDTAKQVAAEARTATNAKPQARGYGRAMGLRDNWVPTLVNAKEAVRYFWKLNPAAFDDFLIGLAKAEIAAGKRTLPGFTIENRPSAV